MKKYIAAVTTFLLITQLSLGQTTITMQNENGVYVIPCTVNELNLKFIFDTGASEVSISLTEALFMLKNGYLKAEDILGKEYYSDANGDISVGTKIILREIDFGGVKLRNVEATVVSNITAPLLLGQTAIAKLGRIQVDFANGTLTIMNGPPSRDYQSFHALNYVPPPKPFSGTVRVRPDAIILDKPDPVNGKVLGKPKDNLVEIVAPVTRDFYRVKSGTIDGYMWNGFFIEQVSK